TKIKKFVPIAEHHGHSNVNGSASGGLSAERIKKLREEIAEIRSEPHAYAQERWRGSRRPRTAAPTIAGNSGSAYDAHRLEKDLNTTPVPYFHAGQDTPSAKA